MARRTLVWHLGLPDPARPVVPESLAEHADALAASGVRVAVSTAEAERATHELLGTHRQAGLRGKDVAGTWARVADAVWSHRGVSVLSTPGLAAADVERLRLAMNPLIGIEVHLVLGVEPLPDQVYGAWVAALLRGEQEGLRKFSARAVRSLQDPAVAGADGAGFADGHDLAALASRWGWTLHADRVHVVAGSPEGHWAAVLGLLGAEGLAPVVPAYVDPAAAAVLREVNRHGSGDLVPADRAGLLATEGAEVTEDNPVPARDLRDLAPVVDRWADDLAAAGHDVRGDLTALLPEGRSVALPGARVRLALAAEALAEVVTERSELRARVARLEQEVAEVDQKRRTWKRRAKKQRPDGADGTDEAALRAVG